jgi:hypothetical protein
LILAYSGRGVTAKKEEWLELAEHAADSVLEKQRELFPRPGDETLWHNRLKAGMEALYEYFWEAQTLGSLINPEHVKGDMWRAEFPQVEGLLEQALQLEKTDDEEHELSVLAHGLAKAARLLAGKYHLVATNVPYLARGKQSDVLSRFCEDHFPDSKKDLATVFVERSIEFCATCGTMSIVLPQNWLFLTSYRRLRERLLRDHVWHLVVKLGPGAFSSLGGEVVKAILLVLSEGQSTKATEQRARNADPKQTIRTSDVADFPNSEEKARQLQVIPVGQVEQASQLANPDARVMTQGNRIGRLLEDVADGVHGLGTKDSPQFIRCCWELQFPRDDWEFMQVGPKRGVDHWGGMESIVFWQGGKGILHERGRTGLAVLAGGMAHGRPGVLVSQVESLEASLYHGALFEKSAAVVAVDSAQLLPAVWCYCRSEDYRSAVRALDQKVAVTNRTLVKVPFDLDHWTKVAAVKYPNGLPKPYSDDPTQWIFHGHPARSEAPLQVAVARLLGYRWPAELDAKMELSDEAPAWVR